MAHETERDEQGAANEELAEQEEEMARLHEALVRAREENGEVRLTPEQVSILLENDLSHGAPAADHLGQPDPQQPEPREAPEKVAAAARRLIEDLRAKRPALPHGV